MRWNGTLDSILTQGAYLIVSNFEQQSSILEETHTLLAEGVASLAGSAARNQIEERGFGCLHEVLPAGQIGALRDFVMPRIRPDLLKFACTVGRNLLGIEGEFFVDDYTILRINYPYLVAMQAAQTAENPGIGRVDERTARESRANRLIDPVYDPKGFHNHEPPPAWAHGPHQDTWTGHSRCGVNLWWAVDDVAEECSMVFYPETFGRHFEPDPRSLYLKEGQPLPKPTKMSLRRGEMLVFNPEMLHGTHLNTSRSTRLALSARLNPRQPRFAPGCFYAREYWHSSANIESGRFDQIIRFARAENLESAESAPPLVAPPLSSTVEVVPVAAPSAEGAWVQVCNSDDIRCGGKLVVSVEDGKRVLLVRGTHRLHAVQSHCAHLNVSLADGYHDDEQIFCPTHAVSFSLTSGRSSCASLTLATYEVKEESGLVWVRPARPGAVDSPSPAVIHSKPRKRLTVSILTRDSEPRLARLLHEVAGFADQVVVGVDAASVDGTLEIAAGLADVVFQFRHSGPMAPARMLTFDYASGDWILSLDDDESIEPSLDALLPDLLGDERATHYWFSRKWIVNQDPCEYLHAAPWFPDWQLRLFRNDRSLAWKPAHAHSGYRVQGPGYCESRASILHFEPLWCSPEARRKKLDQYRLANFEGSAERAEMFYSHAPDTPRRGASRRMPVQPPARQSRALVHQLVRDLITTEYPPWHATIVNVDLSPSARPGEVLIAAALVKNSGVLAWTPFTGHWPTIQLGCHLLDGAGRLLEWEGARAPVPRFVAPGDEVTFFCHFTVPLVPGDYLIEWDMVSEAECWFAGCGSPVLRAPLHVRDEALLIVQTEC